MNYEIRKVYPPSERDSFFSKKPRSETIEQQIERQRKEGKKPNALAELVGKWPGDESLEELLEMLNE